MVAVHIMGGLGNQLFQYASARCLAYRNKAELKFETSECNSQDVAGSHARYRLNNFNIEENFISLDDALKLKRIIEKDHKVFYPEILSLKDDVFLYGYWGHETYFKEIEDILRQELTPKNPFGKISSKWKEKILSAECAVSLHVRHGDYLNPLIRHESGMLPMQYYEDCVAELKKDFPTLTVFVFSDDLQWMKNNFRLNVPTEFVEGCESDIDELFLMSYCKHNIIANSTFSYWGAWLNKNPDKKVFVPKIKKYNFTTLPKSFKEIPIDKNQKPHIEFPPTLSIVLHISDNDIQNKTKQNKTKQNKTIFL